MSKVAEPKTKVKETKEEEAHAIVLDNLEYRYDTSSNKADLSIPQWSVAQGQRIFLYGDSGSGKTTLLNLLAGVLKPTQGIINMLGTPLSSMSGRQRDKFRARHIGVVFQQFNLIPYLSVMKNIQLANYFASKSKEAIEESAKTLLSKLKLPINTLDKRSNELSVGQQQRVAIARALINAPEILLVDEPTSALDMSARDAFMQVLIETCDTANTTLVFVSHDMSLQDYFATSVAMPLLCQPQTEAGAI